MSEKQSQTDLQLVVFAALCVIIGFSLFAYPVEIAGEWMWFTPARFPASVMLMLTAIYFLLLRRR